MLRKLASLLLLFIAGCADISLESRLHHVDALTELHSWKRLSIATDSFDLVAYVPRQTPGENPPDNPLSIYIEGDGLAWISSTRLSGNPTPRNPVGLELALRHPTQAVAYLARPCQYVKISETRGCSAIYWSSHRFAPEVVTAMNQAVAYLKRRFGAAELTLVGYSGGGAIAALVAARRDDVTQLITVAGNLDHEAWTREKKLTPLYGSLNPADYWQALLNIPQLHFIGGRDSVVGRAVTESYLNRYPSNHRPKIQVIEEFNHTCCWEKRWPELLQTTGLIQKTHYGSNNTPHHIRAE
jgi:dienelactone hydrolase